MRVKVQELAGRNLDWAVAKALGYMPAKWEQRKWGRELVLAPEREFSSNLLGPVGQSLRFSNFSPTTDGSQGSALIELENLDVWAPRPAWRQWQAYKPSWNNKFGAMEQNASQYGPTMLVAVCRTFVEARLGKEIEIPENWA